MTNKISYVYKVTNKITGEYYYGYRTIAASKDPMDDLGIEYFTSSKTVQKDFKEAPDNFVRKIVDTFDNKKDAFIFENRLIEMHIKDDRCMNKTYDKKAILGLTKNLKGSNKINGRYMTKSEKREANRERRRVNTLADKQAHWDRVKKTYDYYIDQESGAKVYVIK